MNVDLIDTAKSDNYMDAAAGRRDQGLLVRIRSAGGVSRRGYTKREFMGQQ